MPGPTAICGNPATAAKVITALAGGATESEAAKMIGCHRATIARFKSRAEVRAEIEQQAAALMAGVPTAVEVLTGTAQKGKELLVKDYTGVEDYKERESGRANDIKLIGLANDAAKTIAMTAGIVPSHTTSVIIQNMIIGDSDALSPVISKLLAGSVGQEIDVTPEEEGALPD